MSVCESLQQQTELKLDIAEWLRQRNIEIRKRGFIADWINQNDRSIAKLLLRIFGRKRGSKNTAIAYCIGIKQFCDFVGIEEPEKIIDMLRFGQTDATHLVDSWLDSLAMRDLSSNSELTWISGVKKWLTVNSIQVDWDSIEKPSSETIEEDRAPTSEELKEIIHIGAQKLRDKTIILCAKSSGLRIGTLFSLTWNDLDFDTFKDVVVVHVRAQKGRKFRGNKTFITFFDKETRNMLLKWKEEVPRIIERLKEQIHNYEAEGKKALNLKHKIKALETTIFGLHHGTWRTHWARILKRVGKHQKKRKWSELHFHTLRKFFETRCKVAGVLASFYQHWMTHKHRQDPATYLDASYFRPLLKQHYEQYRKAMPELACLERRASNVERIFSKKLQDLQRKNAEMEEFIHTTLTNIMKTLEAHGMTTQDVSG